MGLFEQFPYTNTHDLNLDWIMTALVQLESNVSDFVSINAIKYANPILWNITSQYEKNTIVLDSDGNAYLSVQAVPTGISIDRTDYWTVIGNFSALWENVREAITEPDEGHNTTASATRSINDLVWVENVLYEVTAPMIAGDTYVTGSNCRIFTMQIFYTYVLEAISNESQARSGADTTLQDNIDAETLSRTNADTSLQDNIDAETLSRTNADTSLQDNIDNVINNNIINMKQLGVVSNGVTDVATLINNIFNTYGENKTFLFTDGEFAIGSPLEIKTGCKILGSGKNSTTFIAIQDMDYMIHAGDFNYAEISDATFNGNSKAKACLYMESAYTTVKNCVFYAPKENAIYLSNENDVVENCITAQDCPIGLNLAGDCINAVVSKSMFFATAESVHIGIVSIQSEGIRFSDCTMAFADTAILIVGKFLVMELTNCIIDQFKKYGIHVNIANVDGLQINNSYIGSDVDNATNSIGVFIAYPTENVIIANCYIVGHTMGGLYINSDNGISKTIKINNTVFRDNVLDIFIDSATGIGIANNMLKSTTGIIIAANVSSPTGIVAVNEIVGAKSIDAGVTEISDY